MRSLSLNKDKCIARSLELRSLRSWFKHLPLIYGFHNRLNDFKCGSYPYEKNQSNIEESIQKNYTDQPIGVTIVTFYTRFILRNIFESWKTYVIYKLRKRKALCEADHIFRRKLKRNVFNVLSKNIMKSNEHYKTTIKRRYFKLWKRYSKIVQMNKSLVEKSRTFYIRTYLQKSITTWKTFVLYKKEKNVLQRKLIEKVSKLYNSNLLHKCFMSWISMHNATKVFKKQLQMVNYYYNKKMLNKYFLAWKAYCNMEKQNKNLQNRADQLYCQTLMKRCLKHFILYIDEVHVHRKKLEMANTFNESKVLIKIFRTWVQSYNQISRLRNIMLKVRQIAEDKIKRKIFLHWKLYVFHKKRTRRKISLCSSIYRKKISTNVFIKLQEYVLYKKRKRAHILSLSNKAVTVIARIQSMYIDKWKKVLNVRMQEKCKIFQAIEFYNNFISKRYLAFWKKCSQHYKVKLLKKKELNDRASYFILNKYIMVWKLKYEENYQIYEKEKLLVSIIHKKIQKKYFMFWQQYRNQKMKKRKDIEYARDMNKKFFLQEGLREILRHSLFTMQFHHENRLKYVTSKSVEDFEILNQYFASWFSLIYFKKKLESLPLERISYCYYRDDVIPPLHTVNKSSELNTFFINDTNNNLYFTSLYNDEPMSS